jgi:hypothetical protein
MLMKLEYEMTCHARVRRPLTAVVQPKHGAVRGVAPLSFALRFLRSRRGQEWTRQFASVAAAGALSRPRAG